VKSYLVGQGIDPTRLSATGKGESSPIGDNASATGRQQNRRVELVVSGEAIGTVTTVTTGALR